MDRPRAPLHGAVDIGHHRALALASQGRPRSAKHLSELIALGNLGPPRGGTKRQRARYARLEQLAKLVELPNDDEALSGHRDW